MWKLCGSCWRLVLQWTARTTAATLLCTRRLSMGTRRWVHAPQMFAGCINALDLGQQSTMLCTTSTYKLNMLQHTPLQHQCTYMQMNMFISINASYDVRGNDNASLSINVVCRPSNCSLSMAPVWDCQTSTLPHHCTDLQPWVSGQVAACCCAPLLRWALLHWCRRCAHPCLHVNDQAPGCVPGEQHW